MNLIVDVGNTRAKVALFERGALRDKLFFATHAALREYLDDKTFDNAIVSSVSVPAEEILMWCNVKGKKMALRYTLPLPIKILYATPATLGADRIAAACGTLDIFPDRNCLVIDGGTCITYEFVDAMRQYHGGAISPGIKMRFEALHTFTARLPLVEQKEKAELIGDSTETGMQSGVINGVLAEVEGIIERYREKHPELAVIICGGDTSFFENNLKQPIFASPDLVLSGLNRILQHNVTL